MPPFSELARRVMARASAALARQERGDRVRQPVEIIPGMPAAPEACFLAGEHWTEARHMTRAIAQPKIDGMRALYLQHRIVTREAQPLDAALHCLPALVRLEERCGEEMVFDGEYQEREGFEATMSAFKRGEGQGIFWLFDAVPYREWKANRFVQPLKARLERIARLEPIDEPFLCFLPPVNVYRPRDVLELADQAWTAGAEGLVVKSGERPYFRGRRSDWMKLKRKITIDVPVLDVVVPGGDPARAKAMLRVDGKSIWSAVMPKHLRELALTDDVTGTSGDGLTGRIVEATYERTDRGTLRGVEIVRLRPDKEKA